jgi:hypothetical protein
VTTYQIGELMGNAYLPAARVQVAVNGFQKTGLYPCNRNIFDDHEFADDAAVLASTSSASHSSTAVSDISPVPHPQKCSAEIKNVATSRRESATLILSCLQRIIGRTNKCSLTCTRIYSVLNSNNYVLNSQLDLRVFNVKVF